MKSFHSNINLNTKKDIIDIFKVSSEKIKVIPLGHKRSQFKKTNVYRKFGIGSRYILSVGSFEPRKNYKKSYFLPIDFL